MPWVGGAPRLEDLGPLSGGSRPHLPLIHTSLPPTSALRLEKIMGSLVEEDTAGPLEAVIHNLSHEIELKGAESKDLQRRWIMYQTELVALQVSVG